MKQKQKSVQSPTRDKYQGQLLNNPFSWTLIP